MSRRVLVILALLLIMLAPAASARGAMQSSTPGPTDGETFIGLADDGITGVAIVIANAGEDEGEARAYFCDGAERSTWLVGTRAGDDLEVAAEDESTLIATIDGDMVTGTVTGPDGAELAFTAQRAAGIAGLFDVVVSEDLEIEGTATDGRRLSGRVAHEFEDGSRLIALLIEQPDGKQRAAAVIASADAGGEQRWIVQVDGGITGSGKPRVGTGTVSVINHEEQYIF